jgi:hypothetical protein
VNDDGDRCPTAPLAAFGYSLESGRWSTSSKAIDTQGVVTDPAPGAGIGSSLVALRTREQGAAGLALVDVKSGTLTDLDGASTATATVCAAGENFIQVTSGSGGIAPSGAATLSAGSGRMAGSLAVKVLKGATFSDVKVTGSTLPADSTSTSVVGCASGGAIIQVTTAGSTPQGYLVTLASGGDSAVLSALPAAPFEGAASVGFATDRTSSDVLVTDVAVAKDQEGRRGPFSILGQDGTWGETAGTLAEGDSVALDASGHGYFVEHTGDTLTLHTRA